jgi:hypothetical protein
MSNTLRNIFQLSETCRSRGPRALAMTLMKQTIVQHEYLRTRNFRRPSILNIFERLARVGQTECAMPQHNDDIAQLAQEAKEDIAVELERLVADGRQWGGHDALPLKYREAVNTIFEHCYYSQASLDMLIASCSNQPRHPFLVKSCNLNTLSEHVAEDMRGLSIEKFGVCPEIVISSGRERVETEVAAIGPLLQFTCVEILKNAVQSVIEKYGELEIDGLDEPPITVHCSRNDGAGDAEWVFEDSGKGLGGTRAGDTCFDALFTTRETMREPNYTYSRDFGVPFSGAGVGLLKSRVYLAMHDATIQIGGRAGNADGALVRVSFQNSVDEVLQ